MATAASINRVDVAARLARSMALLLVIAFAALAAV
jgi:hypothetical protein